MGLKDGINKVIRSFSMTEKERQKQELLDFIEDYRNNNIDEGYNPIHGLDQLTNDDVDYILSISNRGDGKTYGYLGCLCAIAYHFDLPLLLLQRHWTLREGAVDELVTVIEERNALPDFSNYYAIDKQREFTCIYYKEKLIGIVAEIDNSSDLKKKSFFLKKARIIVYDEFITLACDYVPMEATQFVRIYRSVHRGFVSGELPYIGDIKVICLGNPENLTSPILHMLDVTRHVQQQEMNTEKIFKNVYVEKFENEVVQSKVNMRAIPDTDDTLGGEFNFNLHNVPDDETIDLLMKHLHDSLWIKLETGYLEVQYDLKTQSEILLRYVNYNKTYDFCTSLYDIDETVKYIDSNQGFYSDDFYRMHLNNLFYYNDEYTRQLVLKDPMLVTLDIFKLIAIHDEENHNTADTRAMMALERNNFQERDILQESREFSSQWIERRLCYGKL